MGTGYRAGACLAGGASGCGRKTEADGSLPLAVADRNRAIEARPGSRRVFGAADRERPVQRQAVHGPPIMTWTLPGSTKPSPGRITLDKWLIIDNFFDLICGDDHPCLTRSARSQY